MATKSAKEKSLLECAIEAVSNYPKNQNPKTIYEIAKDAMKIKGLKDDQAIELMPRFICDLMESGCFVYYGNGCWDLKENQPTSVLDKDVRDFDPYDPEVTENELNSEGEKTEAKDESYDPEDIEPETDDEMDEIASSLVQASDDEESESEEVETGYEEDEGEDDEE